MPRIAPGHSTYKNQETAFADDQSARSSVPPVNGDVLALAVAEKEGQNSAKWRQTRIIWDGVLSWLETPANFKEGRGYVFGELAGEGDELRKRTKETVISRSALTLDVDHPKADFLDRLKGVIGGHAAALHTTYSSTAEKPRYRVIVPLAASVSPDDYRAAVGELMHRASPTRDEFDRGSSQPERYMFPPSVQDGQEFWSDVWDGSRLDASVLAEAGKAAVQAYVADPVPTTVGGPSDGRAYFLRAVDGESTMLAFHFEGSRNDGLNRSAYKVGQLAHVWPEGSEEDPREVARKALLWSYGENGGLLDDDDGGKEFHRTFGNGWRDGLDNPRDVQAAVAPTGGGVRTEDRDVAEAILPRLKGRIAWTKGLGWLWYRKARGVWEEAPDARVLGLVMEEASRWAAEVLPRVGPDVAKKLVSVRSDAKGRRVMSQLQTLVIRDVDEFDSHPHLLCVGNGVVRLDTGELLPHDPALLLTRSTATPYVPGSTHPDWEKALLSLPADKRDWFQGRVGQGITGEPPRDDRVPFLYNTGSGAKSTLLDGLQTGLGQHMVKVSDKVLTAGADAHGTEMTELRGARLAYIEELPEGAKLNTKRLKDASGTGLMNARRMHKDEVKWNVTHSLMITTNYLPRVAEVDHGTWRRLVILVFPYRYVDSAADILDPAVDRVKETGLRPNLKAGKGGRAEAVLFWAVQGARSWYAADKEMAPWPASVQADTDKWRGSEDLIAGFIAEHLEFDPAGSIYADELYSSFCNWQFANGRQQWSSSLFKPRFMDHELVAGHRVEARRVRSAVGVQSNPHGDLQDRSGKGQAQVVAGLRWAGDK